MNLKSLEYFVEVSKDLNMTSAAQRLYISQQALSLQIQKLEHYYGVTLFERQPKLRLTYAGTQLLESAQRILRENAALKNNLSDISRDHVGVLKVGTPVSRAAVSFQMVLPEFAQKWPNISFQLIEGPTAHMLDMLCEGSLDAAISSPTKGQIQSYSDKLDFTFLLEDSTYLVCSDTLLERYFGERAEEIKKKCANGTDLKEFSEVPFLLHQPPMLLRKTADLCFQRAGFKPKIYAEAMNTDLIVSLYPCHMGAFFCRKAKVPSLLEQFSDCNVFPVKHEDMLYKSPVYFAKRKDLRPPSHLMDFELLVKHAWEKLAQF